MLTGVSTGALIAPLAFLGSDFDQALKKDAYTTIDASRIFVTSGLLPMLSSESAASTKPPQDLINAYISNHVLDLIAASGKPERSELFRKVLPASASIPSRTTRSRFTIHGLSHGRLYDIP